MRLINKTAQYAIVVSTLSLALISGCKTTVEKSVDKHDWAEFTLPKELLEEGQWELKESNSDSFNYSGKTVGFFNKWHDNHVRGWLGPGATHFSDEHSDVNNGYLVLNATPVPEHKLW